MANYKSQFVQTINQCATRSVSIWLMLLRVMIPVSIAVKIATSFGLLERVAPLVAPLLHGIGLPGDTAIVLLSAFLTGLYGGILALSEVPRGIPLTVEQITVLSAVMLSAHAMIVELNIGRMAGLRVGYLLLLRLGFAYGFGWCIHQFCHRFTGYQRPSTFHFQADVTQSTAQWILGEIHHYLVVGVVVTTLVVALRLFDSLGLTQRLQIAMKPLLKPLGMSEAVSHVVVIGMTLGLAYGGGLIVDEVKRGTLSRFDVFMALTLTSLCHSVIEDTALMVMIGGDPLWVLLGRIVLALGVTWLIYCVVSKIKRRLVLRCVGL